MPRKKIENPEMPDAAEETVSELFNETPQPEEFDVEHQDAGALLLADDTGTADGDSYPGDDDAPPDGISEEFDSGEPPDPIDDTVYEDNPANGYAEGMPVSDGGIPEEQPAPEPALPSPGDTPAVKPKSPRRKRLPKPESSEAEIPPKPRPASRRRSAEPPVLTVEAHGEAETQADREDIAWHEIHNAYRTRRILTGTLGGIEQTENRKTLVIVYYKEFRIVIPLSEMMLNPAGAAGQSYEEIMLRRNKILNNMLGADIDFIIKGIDSKTRSVVASRRDAMLKKRQIFYFDTDAATGMYRIYEDRIVQARVIAVSDKVIRVEVFGVECSVMARDLSWDWIGDAHERYSVGDQILVKVQNVRRESLEDVSVKVDVRSVTGGSGSENLKKCRIQGKYAGKVTDVHKGIVFIRLSIGVNAVAHSCYDSRMPGKKDDVSFAVTHLDEERGVAVGIITRIIKQNI